MMLITSADQCQPWICSGRTPTMTFPVSGAAITPLTSGQRHLSPNSRVSPIASPGRKKFAASGEPIKLK